MRDSELDAVHQVFFGLRSGDGVTVLAHTMSDREALPWLSKLKDHVRLLPWETSMPPEKTLSYYQFGEQAVVLRRSQAGASLGRNNAQALIGPIKVLTPRVALGLDSGFAWQENAEAVSTPAPCAGQELVQLAQGRFDELRQRASREPEILKRALRQFIDAKQERLTIIGCAEEHRVALTWALIGNANEYLTHRDRARRNWTFSTYEIDHRDGIPNLPDFLFMPGKQSGAIKVSRKIVDVSIDQNASPTASEWADRLVDNFIADDIRQPETEQRVPAVSATEPMPIKNFHENQVNSHSVEREGAAAPQHESSLPVVNSPMPPRATRSAAHEPAPSPYSAPPHERRSPGKQLAAAMHPPVSSPRQVNPAAIQRLLHCRDRNHFLDRLTALVQGAVESGYRAEIRQLLDVEGYVETIFKIVTWHPDIDEQLNLFQQLRTIAFGPDRGDLADPNVAEFAAQIVARADVPDQFAWGLVQDIDIVCGSSDRVDAAIATRYRRKELRAWDLSARPTSVGSLITSFLRRYRWPLAAATLVLQALLFFEFGRLSVDTPPAGSGSNIGGSQARDLTIQTLAQLAENQVAYLLLRNVTEDKFYPVARCTPETSKLVCTKVAFPPPTLASSPRGFDAVIIRVNQQEEESYQTFLADKKALPQRPDDNTVIFQVAGLA